ncbi:hypothetical protein DKT77_13550 [Meridianimarinicoccus roseus]|uniref:Uncharacterized protein n=1 Tax=Meridianimarinicoccus roseus TaxID=2072018 RepID=A0A2V2LA27_9RHOB|nr:hypothetical protein [Meridianimarinicoccus roseus]PWR02105.1 hypothetical protein DKT77_13550 [Meridianimarinicoccus roseus]
MSALRTALADGCGVGRLCYRNTPGRADLCLDAQVWNNRCCATVPDAWPATGRISTRSPRSARVRRLLTPTQGGKTVDHAMQPEDLPGLRALCDWFAQNM